jgi:anti-sigma regulatory factor (Ser/Thr protein kinase)
VGERRIYEALLPAVPGSVSRIRWDLDRVLSREGVARQRREDIALVLTEAAANVVVHAYVGRPPGPLYASGQLTGQALIILVVDYGRGTGSRSHSGGAGVGLSVMDELADALLVRSNEPEPGTTVEAVFEGIGRANAVPSRGTDAVERAQMLGEYLRVLSGAHASLRQDTEAVLAQANHVLAYARRCQRERQRGATSGRSDPAR